MNGCGSQAGGVSLAGVDVAKEAVIQGVVSRDGAPVVGAYVRLLDSGGEFTAEVPTTDDGGFRFFAASEEFQRMEGQYFRSAREAEREALAQSKSRNQPS